MKLFLFLEFLVAVAGAFFYFCYSYQSTNSKGSFKIDKRNITQLLQELFYNLSMLHYKSKAWHTNTRKYISDNCINGSSSVRIHNSVLFSFYISMGL